MKKLTAIALISIALISCKKETKTITKVNPTTGKTETIEVPVEKTEDNKPAVIFAIKDSLGVYTQKFKLETGKTYPLTTYQRDIQKVTVPNGESQSGTSESTDEMSFTVNGLTNKIYDISINLIGKRNSQTAEGKTIAIDTKQPAPKEDQLKMMWTVNKALTSNKLDMKMDETGKINSITGFDAIYNKVSTSISSLIKDKTQKAGFLKSFKQSFNEKSIREQFSKNLMLIPAKGVKVGGIWIDSENATADGKVKLTTTYTLKSVENGVALITVTGGIPYKSDKKTKDGVTHTMSSELAQTGTIKLDANTGWIINQNYDMKTTQKESITDGKKTQTMIKTSNSTIMINPSAK